MIQSSRVEAGPGFNSEVWAQASWHDGFTTFRNPRQPAEVGTSFAMVHDGEFVHVAIRCDEPQIDRLLWSGMAETGAFHCAGCSNNLAASPYLEGARGVDIGSSGADPEHPERAQIAGARLFVC